MIAPLSLNHLTCICCGFDRFDTLVQGQYDSGAADGKPLDFRVFRCLNCGMAVTDPETIQQVSLAQGDTPPDQRSSTCYEDDIAHVASSTYRVDRLKPYLNHTSRVLEIGCSTGKLVELVQQQGVAESVGVEISLPEANYAHQCNRNIRTTYLHECQFPEGYFDIIQAHHVLEHIPNLVDVLHEVARILKSGGIFYVTVPRYNSWFARSSDWLGWFPQEHIWHFTDRTLIKLLTDHGFALKWYCCPLTNNFLIRQDALYWLKRAVKSSVKATNLGDTVEVMVVKS